MCDPLVQFCKSGGDRFVGGASCNAGVGVGVVFGR